MGSSLLLSKRIRIMGAVKELPEQFGGPYRSGMQGASSEHTRSGLRARCNAARSFERGLPEGAGRFLDYAIVARHSQTLIEYAHSSLLDSSQIVSAKLLRQLLACPLAGVLSIQSFSINVRGGEPPAVPCFRVRQRQRRPLERCPGAPR